MGMLVCSLTQLVQLFRTETCRDIACRLATQQSSTPQLSRDLQRSTACSVKQAGSSSQTHWDNVHPASCLWNVKSCITHQ